MMDRRIWFVVGDVVADSLIHNVFLLAFGNHYYRCLRGYFFDALKGFEASQTRHVFVEYYEVEMPCGHKFKCVAAVVDCHGIVAFRAEKQDVGLQEVDFIVGPKN